MRFGQLNISKMSSHSESSLNKFIVEQNLSLMALQETGPWVQSDGLFRSYKIIQSNSSWKVSKGMSGVSLVIKDSLKPEKIDELDDELIDAVWGHCMIAGKRVIVGSVYTTPTSNSTEGLKSLLMNINRAKEYMHKHKYNSILIYGDYNARSFDWGDHVENPRGRVLSGYLEKEKFTICSPFDLTFVCAGGGSIIDLVLADGPILSKLGQQWIECDSELFTGAPVRGHYPVIQSIDVTIDDSQQITKCLNWRDANWDNWTAEVENKLWALQGNSEVIEDQVKLSNQLLQIIQQANNKHIPQKTISIHSRPFWNSRLTILSKKLREVRRKFCNRSTPNNKNEFDTAKTELKEELILAKNCWVRKRTEGMNIKDSVQFWKKYKRIFGVNQENFIGNLIDDNGILVTADEEKDNIMFEAFYTGKHLQGQSVNAEHDFEINTKYHCILNEIEDNSHESIGKTELNQEITNGEIFAAIKKQDTNDKAMDLDGIHPCLLKQLGPAAILTLNLIFNNVLQNGNWIWKKSLTTFIRKEGKKSYMKPGSYRPISISSYFGKILERVIDNRLRKFMSQEEFVDEDQEGFTSGRSTTRYLFRLLANLCEVKRQKLTCIILFLDFEKAFDSVYIPSLITKLFGMGITGAILRLVHNFLVSRKVCLKINKFIGKERHCFLYGLPQGSVLSPLLFIIYVTDMTKDFPHELKKWMTCFKFADDGTFLIAHKEMSQCYRLMQILCDNLTKWCIKNKLVINCDVDKTEAIILKTSSPISTDIPPLLIGSRLIRYVRSTKVLGIIVDDELSFKQHSSKQLKRCQQKWGLLTKTTSRNYGLNIRSLCLLLKTTVLTKLFYAAPLWLYNNLGNFKGFWNKVIMKISGATLNPNRDLTELALQLPPLEIQLDVLTVKFMCKALTDQDSITSVLAQVDGSLYSEFHKQLYAIRKFVAWKNNSHRSIRNIDLLSDDTLVSVNYSKDEINKYQKHHWYQQIQHRYECISAPSQSQLDVIEILQILEQRGGTFSIQNIFNYNTNKQEDSYLMDFLHGNSLIFGASRYAVTKDNNEDICIFCKNKNDTAAHQLVKCPKFNCHDSYKNLFNELEQAKDSEEITCERYVPCILISKGKLPQAFIERVRFLITQHKIYEEKRDSHKDLAMHL